MSHKSHPIRPTPVEPGKYARLPEPVRLEDTVTSEDVEPVPDQKDDYLRELEWFLRTTGAG